MTLTDHLKQHAFLHREAKQLAKQALQDKQAVEESKFLKDLRERRAALPSSKDHSLAAGFAREDVIQYRHDFRARQQRELVEYQDAWGKRALEFSNEQCRIRMQHAAKTCPCLLPQPTQGTA